MLNAVLSQPRSAASSEWRDGWRTLFAGSVGVGLGYNLLMYSAGLFIVPMQQEFGWSRSSVVLGPAVGMIAAFFMPLCGMALDRWGSRHLTIFGLAALAVGFLGFAAVPANHLVFFGLVFLVAAVSPFSSPISFCRGVATWFLRNTGAAMAITMSGISVVGLATFPMIAATISHFGWRMGFVALAAMVILIAIPVSVMWFHERPAAPLPGNIVPGSEEPAGVLRRAIRDARFWLMVSGFGSASVLIGGTVSQLQPLLIDRGFSVVSAAGLGSLYALSIGIGRLCAGFMLDHLRPARVAMAFLLLAAVGGLTLAYDGQQAWLLTALAISLIGLGHGAESDFIAFFAVRIFGMQSVGTIFGVMALVIGVGMAGGGYLYAILFDMSGSYILAMSVASGLMALAAILIGSIRLSPEADRPR